MEIHQLQYVLAVEKYRHFSLAAEEINVSQPTLSHQIKKLESELGVQLFIRTTRSVMLTPAGEELVEYAKRTIADMDNIKNAMLEHTNLEVGSIRIGTVPNISYLGITSLIANFKKIYPGIHIKLYENNSEILLKQMYNHEIDVAFINLPHTEQDTYDYYPLMEDKFALFMSRHHPLGNKKQVDLSELSEEKFIIFKMGSALRTQFIQLCREAGFTPDIIFESIHMETMKSLAEEGVGVLLTSKKAALSVVSSKTTVVDLSPDIERMTGLVVSKNSNLLSTKAFRDFILEYKNAISKADPSENDKMKTGGMINGKSYQHRRKT